MKRIIFYSLFILLFGTLVYWSLDYYYHGPKVSNLTFERPVKENKNTVSKDEKVFGFTHSWVFPQDR